MKKGEQKKSTAPAAELGTSFADLDQTLQTLNQQLSDLRTHRVDVNIGLEQREQLLREITAGPMPNQLQAQASMAGRR